MSTDIKLSKPQIYKIIQSEGFLAVPLGGKKLVPLGLTAAVSAAEAKIQKGIWKRRDNRVRTTLVILSEDMSHNIKNIKSLKDSGSVIDEFPRKLLGTLGASILWNMLNEKGKCVVTTGTGPNIDHMGQNF